MIWKKACTILTAAVVFLFMSGLALAEMKYKEAPMLRVKVAEGLLPPVEERLPKEPVVIEPVEEIGQYGGTWNRAWLGRTDQWAYFRVTDEWLVRFDSYATKLMPNICKSWEVSEEGKVYTFHLREGMKWSDGAPFTANDMLFYWEDIILNEELTPVIPDWLKIAGEPGRFEKIDDYTVRITFSKPFGIFLIGLAIFPQRSVAAPKHYLRQFHPRYTPMEKLEEMVKDAGREQWYELFNSKNLEFMNPDRPVIRAWKVTVPLPATRMVMERNPYYWKVDPEGNQLPYIDRVVHTMVEDKDLINFKAMSGEIDMQARHILTANYTLFRENEEKGDYRVLKWTESTGAHPVLMPNIGCKDPVLRKLFNDDRFRKALSLAINREEINEFCWLGMAEPRQASLNSGNLYFSEEWEKAYAEYDPARANTFLNEMELTKRDKEGFRLRPDGKTLLLTIEFAPVFGPWGDTLELVKGYWEAIGIRVVCNAIDRSLAQVRWDANEFEIGVWTMDRQVPILTSPVFLLPMDVTQGIWHRLYSQWYTSGGEVGEKPTGDVARLLEIWEKLRVTVDEEERAPLVHEVIQLHIKNIWLIGTVGEPVALVVVKNNFRNVPEECLIESNLLSPRNAYTEQFFIKQK